MDRKGHNLVDKVFKLSNYPETDFKTEVIAGITTFFTMAYVLATIPNMLATNGIPAGPILTSMIFLITATTIAMGVITNRPFALAPGLSSTAIVAGMIVNENIPPSIAAGIIFLSGMTFVIISFVGLREAVVRAIPLSLKQAFSVGIGINIATIGARNAGIIVANEAKNSLTFGVLNSPEVILAAIGFLVILWLHSRKVTGNIMLGIIVATIIGIPIGITKLPNQVIALPSSMGSRFLNIDIVSAFNMKYLPYIIPLFVSDFFSTLGTVIGVGTRAGFLDEDGNLDGIDRCFQVDAVSTVVGSLFGIPTMTTYLESSAGVESGGRTGLTAVVVGLCFILTIFFSPLALTIPTAAVSSALIFIGLNMMNSIKEIEFDDFTEAFPAFVCIAFIILSGSTANGICLAILVYVFLKLVSGKRDELDPLTYVLTLVSILYFSTLL